jgi:DNA-binding response OmpR family regulator
MMADLHAARALIVDDNYYNRDLCRLALEQAGYDIAEAKTGKEAVSFLKEQTFDLMVLDLAMPELNGVDVIREIGHQAKHQAMSIIVMTANPHMATEEVELEADFVLYKPIDILEFSVFVRRLSERLY